MLPLHVLTAMLTSRAIAALHECGKVMVGEKGVRLLRRLLAVLLLLFRGLLRLRVAILLTVHEPCPFDVRGIEKCPHRCGHFYRATS
jgi:hypothetical protein